MELESELTLPSGTWAVRLSSFDASIGKLRQFPGIDVLPIESPSQNCIWIKGETLNEQVSKTLRSLPDAQRFLVMPDNSLTSWGETVPRALLPEGTWLPITEWLTLMLPTAAFAPAVQQRIPLTLVRSDTPAEANLLKVTWSVWRDYATQAPQIRLNQWSFAVSDQGEAVVRGTPVAPIPGIRYVEQSGIAIPSGWQLDPPIAVASVRKAMSSDEETIALISKSGAMEVIPLSAFVSATRSAVRLTDDSFRK